MSSQKETRIVDFVINGKSAELSLNQVKKEILALTKAFSALKQTDNPKLYKEKAHELRKLTEVYKGMRQEINGAKTDSQKFFSEFKTLAAGVLGGNLITGMVQQFSSTIRESIKKVVELSDEITSIEKTTNLTTEQVKELDKELGKIDTRTGRSELRQFAVEAGKLGKDSVESVRKFVEEADKINVALGEDLGRDAVIEIVRLAEIFKEESLDIGSAINSIGQASVATEAFQVDFLKRTAAMGIQIGLTSKELLGYGAALEINGATAEVSGTAMLNFFGDFIKDADKMGEVAGFAKGELRKLMEEKGTNAGFIEFLNKLKEGSSGAEDLLKKLEDIGIDGARGSNALLILANSTSDVVAQQKVAAESAGSIIAEFNKRNNNAAANYEKAMKKLEGALVPIKQTIGGFFIGLGTWLADNIKLLITLAKVLVVGAVAWGTYKAAVMTAVIAKRLFSVSIMQNTTLITLQRLAVLAGAAAQALFTGNITRATAAMRVFNTVSKLNPFGLILSAVTLAVTGFMLFRSEAEKLTETQKAITSATAEAAKAIATEKNEYERNVKILDDKNNSEAVREAALKRLIALNPDMLKGLTTENFHTAEGTLIRNNYNKELIRTAELKAKIAKVDQLSADIEDLKVEKDNPSERVGMGKKIGLGVVAARTGISYDDLVNKVGLKEIDAEIDAKKKAVAKLNEDINKIQVTTTTHTSSVTGGTYTSEAAMKAAEDANNKAEKKKISTHKQEKKSIEDLSKIKEDRAKKDREAIEEEFELSMKYSAAYYRNAEALISYSRSTGLISEEDYQAELLKIEEAKLQESLRLHIEYGKEYSEVALALANEEIEAQKRAEADKAGFSMVQPKGTFGKPAFGKQGKHLTGEGTDAGDEKLLADIEKVDQAMAYASSAADMMEAFSNVQIQKMQNELAAYENLQNGKKNALQRQLDQGLISQEEYNLAVENIDKETADKQRKVKEESWKKQKRAAVIESVINGILAVTRTLAAYSYPVNLVLAALAGGVAAYQTSAIAKQPMPQFYSGGDTMVTGAMDNKQYRARRVRSIAGGGGFNNATVGLVAERGPEYVIPNFIYGNPKFANIIGALEAARTNQYYNGGDTGGNNALVDSQAGSMMMADLTMAIRILVAKLDEPIVAKTFFDIQEHEEAVELRDKALLLGKF